MNKGSACDPAYLQDREQLLTDIREAYTPKDKRGMALAMLRWSKRYILRGKAKDSKQKGVFYFRLAETILSWQECQYIPLTTNQQFEFDFVEREVEKLAA